MSFVGSKNGEGVYQRIIGWMPPHGVYIEPFAGTAAVFRHKRPAPQRSILIDLAPGPLDEFVDADRLAEVIVGDGVEFLRRFHWPDPQNVLVYADPPYLRDTRRDPDRDYYAAEWTREDHERFLDVAVASRYRLLISGYHSELYAEKLAGWDSDHFQVMTRGGPADEWLWANYPRPTVLHDYRYLGKDFAERWRIHKRQRSWCRMLDRMEPAERRAMLAQLADEFAAEFPRSSTAAGVGGRPPTIPSMVATNAAGVAGTPAT